MDLSAKDLDLMTRTILSEAGPNASAAEQAAIAHVILNRVGNPDYAPTVSGVVRQKGQFEPWSLPRQGPGSDNHPSKWDAKSAAYQTASAIAQGAASGAIDDPTEGADHFLQPETVQQRVKAGKMAWPSWAQDGQGQRIGQHAFYKPQGDDSADRAAILKAYQEKPPGTVPAAATGTSGSSGASAQDDAERQSILAAYNEPQLTPNERVAAGQEEVAAAPLKPAPEPPVTIAGIPLPSTADVWDWAKKNPELAGAGAAGAIGLGALMLPEGAVAAGAGLLPPTARALWSLLRPALKTGAAIGGGALGYEYAREDLMRDLLKAVTAGGPQ